MICRIPENRNIRPKVRISGLLAVIAVTTALCGGSGRASAVPCGGADPGPRPRTSETPPPENRAGETPDGGSEKPEPAVGTLDAGNLSASPSIRREMQEWAFGPEVGNDPATDMQHFREEADPIRQARKRLRMRMQERAEEVAVEAARSARPAAKPKDPNVNMAGWQFSIGNNGNWSPFPDRALDARVIRYPMRDIRELDRSRQKAGPPHPARRPR